MATTFYRRDDWVTSALGQSIAGADVYVTSQPTNQGHFDDDGRYWPPTPQVQLYADAAGSKPLAQPVQTDGFGHAFYYVAQGVYTVTYYSPQIGQSTLQDQVIAGAAAQIYSTAVNGIIDGSNRVFTIAVAPSAFLMLFMNGVMQVPNTDYTISGNTIIFVTTTPQVGDQLWAVYQ
jgi:hypothetical protein